MTVIVNEFAIVHHDERPPPVCPTCEAPSSGEGVQCFECRALDNRERELAECIDEVPPTEPAPVVPLFRSRQVLGRQTATELGLIEIDRDIADIENESVRAMADTLAQLRAQQAEAASVSLAEARDAVACAWLKLNGASRVLKPARSATGELSGAQIRELVDECRQALTVIETYADKVGGR